MTTFIRPRLRKPVVIALVGTAFASAWLVHGGPSWWWWSLAVAGAGRECGPDRRPRRIRDHGRDPVALVAVRGDVPGDGVRLSLRPVNLRFQRIGSGG